MFADLHLHSLYSDGTDTPDDLISLANFYEISVISIADHDTVEGYNNINIQNLSVKVIPAIEVSTILSHSYLHILGYFIDVSSKELSEYIMMVSDEKTENTRINFENAKKQLCFCYDWERVLEFNKNKSRLSGIHVIYSLQNDNYCINGMSLQDLLQKYFLADSLDFIPTETATAYDAIDIIKKAGGIPIIAHPKSIGNDTIVHDLLNYGAQGLEVFHPIHTNEDVLRYQQLAETRNLYITGGTDWHGKNNKKYITHFGMCGLKSDKYSIFSNFL